MAEFPLSAAVLVGGRSSRMGSDKATLRLLPGGPTLMELVLAALSEVSDDLMVVGSDRTDLLPLLRPRARIVTDRYPGAGPLGGIASAVAAAACPRTLVVACDMPFLSPTVLRLLARWAPEADVVIPELRGESRQGGKTVFQTLHAIYGVGALPVMERALEHGNNQVIGWFSEVDVQPVNEPAIRNLDPNLLGFTNVNTPEALSRVRTGLEQGTLSLP